MSRPARSSRRRQARPSRTRTRRCRSGPSRGRPGPRGRRVVHERGADVDALAAREGVEGAEHARRQHAAPVDQRGPRLEARGVAAGVEDRVRGVERRVALGKLAARVRSARLLAALAETATSRASGYGSSRARRGRPRCAPAREPPDGLARRARGCRDRVAGMRSASPGAASSSAFSAARRPKTKHRSASSRPAGSRRAGRCRRTRRRRRGARRRAAVGR